MKSFESSPQEKLFEQWAWDAQLSNLDPKNIEQVMALHRDNWPVLSHAPGSTFNHQAWEGGYIEHVAQVNSYVALIYTFWQNSGMLETLPPEEVFTLGEALTVSTLHDIEKPFITAVLSDGRVARDQRFKDKASRQEFRDGLLSKYGIEFNPNQANAFKYAEGMRDDDYSPGSRVMLPIAALVHTADLLSARGSYSARMFT